MDIRSIYPVLQVAEPESAGDYFVENFAFERTFSADWYVSLRHGVHELAFLHHAHPTIPEGFRRTVTGILVNIEVDDATVEYERLVRAGLTVLLELRDEPFGQRHFILEGPEGIAVDVIEEIPPAPEYALAFTS